jgi:nucleotide-binding universal stress UspA family protein
MTSLNPQRVLVAVDRTQVSLDAVRAGLALAAASQAKVGFVCVVPDEDTTPEAELVPQLRAELSPEAAAFKASFELFILRGEVVDSILDQAKEWSAELLIVGSRGLRGIERMLLGSVAEAVVRRATMPVLVVRAPLTPGLVMSACDLGESTESVIRWSAQFARWLDGTMLAFHSLQGGMGDAAVVATAIFGGAVPAQPDVETTEGLRTLARASIEVALAAAGATAEVEVFIGDAAESVAQRAQELGAVLLVTGSHGRKGLARLVLGSVAETLVRTAPCSVLVAR